MKKKYSAPRIVSESNLAQLTQAPPVSTAGADGGDTFEQ
jgi:hypothetical protein